MKTVKGMMSILKARKLLFNKKIMKKLIANANKKVEVHVNSGTARLRFNEEGVFQLLLKEKLAERKMLNSQETSSLLT